MFLSFFGSPGRAVAERGEGDRRGSDRDLGRAAAECGNGAARPRSAEKGQLTFEMAQDLKPEFALTWTL